MNEEYDSPVDAIPGYETDLSAVGTNRRVDIAAVDERPWYELFPAEDVDQLELPADAVIKP